jgi:hypothetical protein
MQDGPRGIRPDSSQLVAERVDAQRLLVLVPDAGLDANELARQVWALAAPCELHVHFLCVLQAGADHAGHDAAMRLRLATLASLIRDDHVDVNTEVAPQQGWVTAVRRAWQPGDLVLCCAEQKVATVATGNQPLYAVLEFALDVPVFVLTGLYSEPPGRRYLIRDALPRIGYWVVICALLVGFFVVDAQIGQQTAGLAHALLLLAASLVEIGLIALWIRFV